MQKTLKTKNNICSFGCNKEGTVKLLNGKWCCSSSPNRCEGKKKRTKNRAWNKGKNLSDNQKLKLSASLKKAWAEHPEQFSHGEKHSRAVGKGTVGKFKTPISILQLSSRTQMKIIRRLCLSCSICGWNKGHTDIHHINGRKIENPNAHSNLTCVCPNCHRLLHQGILNKELAKSFVEQIGDRWKEFYYG